MRAAVAASSPRPARRSAAGLAAGLAATGLLAGCTGGGGPAAGAPQQVASPAASTAPAPAGTPAGDLASGLLPADAFGAGATVVPVTLAELQQRLTAVPGGLTAALAEVQVTPVTCAAALQTVGAGLAGLTGLAGEGARTAAGGTAEALLTGAPAASAVGALTSVAGACSDAQVTSSHGTATVHLDPVDVGDLGDGAAGVSATAVLTPAGRAPVTVSALLAAVQDGDRLLLLGTAAPGGAGPDRASFTSLLQRAFDTESHALG